MRENMIITLHLPARVGSGYTSLCNRPRIYSACKRPIGKSSEMIFKQWVLETYLKMSNKHLIFPRCKDFFFSSLPFWRDGIPSTYEHISGVGLHCDQGFDGPSRLQPAAPETATNCDHMTMD